MTLDAVRKLLLCECQPYLAKDGRGFGLRGWCKANGVANTHASDFLQGKRNPGSDLLQALGLEWRVMRKRSYFGFNEAEMTYVDPYERAKEDRDELRAETAIKSCLPVHSGDGYQFGGEAIVTIGNFSILFGEGEPAHWLAQEVADRWNGERNGDR